MKSLTTGAPHFRSVAKQHRHANYTLEKVINEAIDNIIKKATEIHLTTDIDSDGRLQELKISDNYVNGFESINQEGIANPFNMGHIKTGHDLDDETSEFGVGLKAGALSAANELSVITNLGNGIFYQVVCDFLKMEKEEDVNASYNPKIKEITEADYKQIHPFTKGSSIVLSKIRETICEKMTQRKLTDRIKLGISETYSRFLTANMSIFVNGEPVVREIDFFSDVRCVQFTLKKRLFVLEKGGDRIYLINKTIESPVWQIWVKLNKEKNLEAPPIWVWKWDVLKLAGKDFITEKQKEGYIFAHNSSSVVSDGSCMKIDTVFTFYSDSFHTKDSKTEPEKPFDQVLIYKDDRKYGKKSLAKQTFDGNNTYTLHRIDFSSKQIGKELGITFNKDITMEGTNELTMAIKAAIDDSRLEFNSNVSTTKNEKLCEKAIKRNIINWTACNIEKLSTYHRELRKKHEETEQKKEDARKKKEAEDLRKAMEDDILRKKKEADDLKAANDKREAEEEAERKRKALETETPEKRNLRLIEEEKVRKAEELKAAKEKKERDTEDKKRRQEELDALKRKEVALAAEKAAEEDRRQKEALEEDKRRKKAELEALEAEKKRIEVLKAQQESSRQRLREVSQLLLLKIESDELISLDDSNSILNKVKEILKM